MRTPGNQSRLTTPGVYAPSLRSPWRAAKERAPSLPLLLLMVNQAFGPKGLFWRTTRVANIGGDSLIARDNPVQCDSVGDHRSPQSQATAWARILLRVFRFLAATIKLTYAPLHIPCQILATLPLHISRTQLIGRSGYSRIFCAILSSRRIWQFRLGT